MDDNNNKNVQQQLNEAILLVENVHKTVIEFLTTGKKINISNKDYMPCYT